MGDQRCTGTSGAPSARFAMDELKVCHQRPPDQPIQGQPPRAWAAAAVLAWTTAMVRGGTYPDRPVMSCRSTTTSQVATMAARRVRPVAGWRVPGGFLKGRRT